MRTELLCQSAGSDGLQGCLFDTFEALVFLADEVLDRDLDVFECNVSGAAAPDALAIHPSCADTAVFPLDEEDGDTVHAFLASAHSGGEIVAPDTIGDPLLLAVDDVVLAVLCEFRFTRQVRDVAAGIWLGDGKTDSFIAVQYARNNPIDQRFLPELDNRWTSNAKPTDQVPYESTTAGSCDLVCDKQFMEEIPLVWRHALDSSVGKMRRIVHTHQTREIPAFAHRFVNAVRDLLGLIPLRNVRLELSIHPLSNFGAKSSMGFVEVSGVILSTPVSISKSISTKAITAHGRELTLWYQDGSAKGT